MACARRSRRQTGMPRKNHGKYMLRAHPAFETVLPKALKLPANSSFQSGHPRYSQQRVRASQPTAQHLRQCFLRRPPHYACDNRSTTASLDRTDLPRSQFPLHDRRSPSVDRLEVDGHRMFFREGDRARHRPGMGDAYADRVNVRTPDYRLPDDRLIEHSGYNFQRARIGHSGVSGDRLLRRIATHQVASFPNRRLYPSPVFQFRTRQNCRWIGRPSPAIPAPRKYRSKAAGGSLQSEIDRPALPEPQRIDERPMRRRRLRRKTFRTA